MAGFFQRAKNAAKQAAANAGASAVSDAINQGAASMGLETNISLKAPNVNGASGGDGYYAVDLPHGFSQRMEQGLDAEEMARLRYPQAPADLPAGAAQYAQAWYQPWSALIDGHVDIARAAEAGDLPSAQQLLYRWEQGIGQAQVTVHQLGDFNGSRALSAVVGDVYEAFDMVADALREYMDVRSQGRRTDDAVEEVHKSIIGLHLSIHGPIVDFFADPSGAAMAQAEQAAFGDINAMISGAGADTSGPEFAPVQGVSLHDYVAGSQRMHEGTSADVICSLLGVERPMWDAASAEWMRRMTETHPMTVGMQYRSLSTTPHPVLTPEACAAAGGAASALPGGDNSARLSTDMSFYIEASAAMQAAAEAGIDGGGYLESTYGVTVMQVATAGGAWMSDMRNADRILTLQEAKKKEIFTQLTGYSADTAPGALPDGVEDIAADIEF